MISLEAVFHMYRSAHGVMKNKNTSHMPCLSCISETLIQFQSFIMFQFIIQGRCNPAYIFPKVVFYYFCVLILFLLIFLHLKKIVVIKLINNFIDHLKYNQIKIKISVQ